MYMYVLFTGKKDCRGKSYSARPSYYIIFVLGKYMNGYVLYFIQYMHARGGFRYTPSALPYPTL